MNEKKGKPVSQSHVTLSQLMQPEHANSQGNVHGGWIMKLIDEAGALACMRHSQMRVVTVVVDQITFNQPIRIGDLVTIEAEVSYVGRTSMETEVHVTAENPITGEKTHTNTAYLVFVAIGPDNNPIEVPRLLADNESQAERMKAGIIRQKNRLERNRK